MIPPILATILALSILTALIIFQVALIAGAPIGRFAWGGQHKVLPKKLRISSAVSIVLYIIFGLFIASKAGIVNVIPAGNFLDITMWIFTGYFLVGIFLNGISRSRPERLLMTPIAGLLTLFFLIVSLS